MFRFDKLVYLGVSKDKQSQLKIITALTRKYVQSVVCRIQILFCDNFLIKTGLLQLQGGQGK